MTATVPASSLASAGSAAVTVVNPPPNGGSSAPQSFTIAATPAATTWVRSVAGIAAPQDIVWDSVHSNLYVSVGSSDPVAPSTIVTVNPVTAVAGTPVAAGNNPDLLSMSSDAAYLWVALDGASAVQRFQLPSMAKDVSFPLPSLPYNIQPQAISLEAAPDSPHTVGLIDGNWGESPSGDGVYIFDDVTQRPTFVPGSWGTGGGPVLDWIQWGGNDSTIYANPIEIFAGGIATLNVNSSGVSLASYNGGQVAPSVSQYDSSNGLLYSWGGVFDPVSGSLLGLYGLPAASELACTTDSSLGRYYCVAEYDESTFELWVFDLNTYAVLERVNLGEYPGSSVTGEPFRLVRWGNAGLALSTFGAPYAGNGGVFLIDGAAVNPNAAPDVSSGTAATSYATMTSLNPQQITAGAAGATVTINGTYFTQSSTACANYNAFGFQYLPTSYVSPQQLNVTIPAGSLSAAGPMPISILDSGSGLLSNNALTFTVANAGGNTQVTALNLPGQAMAWDANSQLLYVGTTDYGFANPDSIVAVNGQTGVIASTTSVEPNPLFLGVSANGQYLYVAYGSSTNMSQLPLPSLGPVLTWPLTNSASSTMYYAGDMKAAPVSPHTTALTLFDYNSQPWQLGGVVVFDDNVERPTFAPFNPDVLYSTVAWSASDEILAASDSALDELQVTPSGVTLLAAGTATFNNGEIHSDYGTGLIYSDDGNVGDPSTQAVVGSYGASGLVAPDSSLNSVFILGQTAGQANSNSYTIQSFNETTYAPISSITLDTLEGTPLELIRWGTSGLAVVTMNPNTFGVSILTASNGPAGMLYLIQDSNFVSTAPAAIAGLSAQPELVQTRWKRISRADISRMSQAARPTRLPRRKKIDAPRERTQSAQH